MENHPISNWLVNRAFPLWSGKGLDRSSGLAWEALDHDGQPLEDMTKRLRVQARQAYCFATGAALEPGLADLGDTARALFATLLDKGIHRDTGHLAAQFNPDGTIRSAPNDLYDVAFVLLAASALIRLGYDMAPELAKAEAMLARLKAPRGWHECGTGAGIRRQNPHMHLFECATALYDATGEPRFKAIADECLDLFRTVFLQPDGSVFERFEPDWRPRVADQVVEPGHMTEWIFLIDAYEEVTRQDTGVDLARIFDTAWAARDGSGALPDHSVPRATTRRCWPQTELLKASIVLERRGHALPGGADPESILAMLRRDYLDVPVTGGWYDKRTTDGDLVSDMMPASTFYHILVAVRMFLEREEALAAEPPALRTQA